MHDPKKVLEICSAATPGPWIVKEGKSFGVQSENKNIASCVRKENEQFIALARTVLPEFAIDGQDNIGEMGEVLYKAGYGGDDNG